MSNFIFGLIAIIIFIVIIYIFFKDKTEERNKGDVEQSVPVTSEMMQVVNSDGEAAHHTGVSNGSHRSHFASGIYSTTIGPEDNDPTHIYTPSRSASDAVSVFAGDSIDSRIILSSNGSNTVSGFKSERGAELEVDFPANIPVNQLERMGSRIFSVYQNQLYYCDLRGVSRELRFQHLFLDFPVKHISANGEGTLLYVSCEGRSNYLIHPNLNMIRTISPIKDGFTFEKRQLGMGHDHIDFYDRIIEIFIEGRPTIKSRNSSVHPIIYGGRFFESPVPCKVHNEYSLLVIR